MNASVSSASPGPSIIVALDFADPSRALEVAEGLSPDQCRVKVGKELFVRGGPDVVRSLHALGHSVFLDLKFHDIPNTVAGACAAAADLGVWMMNVHVAGGLRMMQAARDATAGSEALLIGVTVLTSLAHADLVQIGLDEQPQDLVVRWGQLAHEAGLAGVVCSPVDLEALAKSVPASFLKVTPGVRPGGADAGDQRRIATPAEARAKGASYLVIGRPITEAVSPADALAKIVDDLATA